MQGRRSRPKNGLNGRASYLCCRAKMTHGREVEPENDGQPDLRQKLTPGSGGISQPSFSAFLPKVLDAIIRLTPRHICFPNTLQKQQETKQGFYAISGFPHVLGAIDCTHVRLVPPAATEHLYRNRKHTHSINVQAIVDHQGMFTNIVAKYPGSVHDSFIFRHCTINQHFQDGQYGNGLLVGKYKNLLIYTLHSNPLEHNTYTTTATCRQEHTEVLTSLAMFLKSPLNLSHIGIYCTA
ncbi:hypothetical protein NDU88_001717 [Pleurodeles waltl]|uniref:DDE Tnp4 domain-containing protein n=1 Tax=Pleurodeles waltl TaxID=8319 RepID=A0AAV7UTJ8_PLEWA|nr:hypothetical protein NDU88_001717 [Pleurodeles waltl]